MEASKPSPYLIPAAIVLAGAIIAAALFFRGGGPTSIVNPGTQEPDEIEVIGTVPPVTNADYILGDPNAKVVLVEYSDLECPFCKRFHFTVKQLMEEYGKDGRLAWVYRNFPLDSLHSKARTEAVALECAGKLGGSSAYWRYLDELMTVTPSNNGLDLAELPKIATKIGLSKENFASCQASGEFDAKIERQAQEAIATGGEGTPWNILITKSGKQIAVAGAYPYEDMKRMIEEALAGEKK